MSQSAPHSSLARLQQTLGGLWLLTGAGLVAWSLREPVWGVMALLLWIVAQPGLLGLQFVLAGWVNAREGVVLRRRFPWAVWWSEVRTAARVFGVWQPWAWRAHPDFLPVATIPADPPSGGHRGVLLVHGFMCNRGFWNPWLADLHRCQHPVVAVNLEPVLGPINAYCPILDQAVRRLTAATGEPPLVVAHSMGGLAVRAWLQAMPGAIDRVAHIVTIGTPHAGTWLARFGHGANAAQMRPSSAWLTALARTEGAAVAAKFTCWHSNGDNIVFPFGSAVLPGSEARHVPGVGHVALAFNAELMGDVLGRLRM
jgi:triacylglycerol lipase